MDERFQLAHHEAEKALAQQDVSLANLRDRAAGLLSTATVLTTLAPALGLIASDPDGGNVLPRWLSLVVVAVVVAIGVCAVAVLAPRTGWVFTNNARILADDWIGVDQLSIEQMHYHLAVFMRSHEENNRVKLDRLYRWYRIGIALLIVQTGVLVTGFTFFSTR